MKVLDNQKYLSQNKLEAVDNALKVFGFVLIGEMYAVCGNVVEKYVLSRCVIAAAMFGSSGG